MSKALYAWTGLFSAVNGSAKQDFMDRRSAIGPISDLCVEEVSSRDVGSCALSLPEPNKADSPFAGCAPSNDPN